MNKIIKNNKGFTLVELLASIGILALISIIAVPSIINLTNKNKKTSYVNDAKRFISLVQYETRSNKHLKQSLSINCDNGVYTGGVELTSIDHSDITTSPENMDYSGFVIKNNGEYYVCLTDTKYLVSGSLTELNSDDAITYVHDDLDNMYCDITETNNILTERMCK